MTRAVAAHKAFRHARYGADLAERVPTLDVFLLQLEELAQHVHARPPFWLYFLTDLPLWWSLISGPLVPSRYRLVGPGRDARAREKIVFYPTSRHTWRVLGPFLRNYVKYLLGMETQFLPSIVSRRGRFAKR